MSEQEWYTAEEVVKRYRLASVASLYAMRARGRGPHGHRFGRKLMFNEADLKAWEAQRADKERAS